MNNQWNYSLLTPYRIHIIVYGSYLSFKDHPNGWWMYSAGLTMKLEIPQLTNIFQGSIIIETIGRVSKTIRIKSAPWADATLGAYIIRPLSEGFSLLNTSTFIFLLLYLKFCGWEKVGRHLICPATKLLLEPTRQKRSLSSFIIWIL